MGGAEKKSGVTMFFKPFQALPAAEWLQFVLVDKTKDSLGVSRSSRFAIWKAYRSICNASYQTKAD